MRGKVKENANYFVANPVVYRFVAKMPDLAPLVDMKYANPGNPGVKLVSWQRCVV